MEARAQRLQEHAAVILNRRKGNHMNKKKRREKKKNFYIRNKHKAEGAGLEGNIITFYQENSRMEPLIKAQK